MLRLSPVLRRQGSFGLIVMCRCFPWWLSASFALLGTERLVVCGFHSQVVPRSLYPLVSTSPIRPAIYSFSSISTQLSLEDRPASGESVTTSGASAVLSQVPTPTDATEFQMLSFYHFEPILDPLTCRDQLFAAINMVPGLRGTIYLAKEGVNAQLAVPTGKPLEDTLQAIRENLPFDPFSKLSPNLGKIVRISTPTFNRLIVRLRDYVLRDGIPEDIDLDWSDPGPELSPAEWHQDLSSTDPSKLRLLDCRNLYESDEGTFRGAVPLGTNTFQDSWEPLEELTKDMPKDEPVHIFCTGGIRCVKVGAYLKQHLGFEKVRRLQHGIIGYEEWLEDDSEGSESVWEGENFLFDKRRFKDKSSTE